MVSGMRGMMIFWTLVAVLCAVAFGFVTGVFNPEEKVNSLWLVVAAACFHVLALRFYGRFLARRVAGLNDRLLRAVLPVHGEGCADWGAGPGLHAVPGCRARCDCGPAGPYCADGQYPEVVWILGPGSALHEHGGAWLGRCPAQYGGGRWGGDHSSRRAVLLMSPA